MSQGQRRLFVGGALVLVVVVALVVGLVAKGGSAPNDSAALRSWYVAHGMRAYTSTTQEFDTLLTGLDHSKVDNGGPGILAVEPTCQSGAASVRTFSSVPPPSAAPLSTTYKDMMDTGSEVFAHCLEGIEATSLATSKLKVNLMLAEMTTYSKAISTFGHGLTAAGL